MLKTTLIFILFAAFWSGASAQTGILQGKVSDAETQEELVGAVISIEGTQLGATSDVNGDYIIRDIPQGTYTVRCAYIGYKTVVKYQVLVEKGVLRLNFAMSFADTTLETVQITASAFQKTSQNLVSVRTVGAEQIRSNPGGNFDISRVVQTLPGVSGSVGFRNDIIVRGGGPNENVFYLDGVEIPNLNHFATQGSGGGPNGIINSVFIENVKFQSSAFGARYDNTLSSVLDFEMISGNTERFQTTIQVGASDAGLTFDTPIGKKVTALVSARVSYLQFLFKLIDLPFLPTYYDAQSKVEWKINPKTTASWIFIGAIDRFDINRPEAPDPAKFNGEDDPKFIKEQSSFFDKMQLFESIPIFNQNSYSTGLTLKRLTPRGFYNVVLSRNMLRNMIFLDTVRGNKETRIQDFNSLESENKLRVNFVNKLGDWEVNYGGTFQHGRFTNNSFLFVPAFTLTDSGWTTSTRRLEVNEEINLFKYGAYGSVSRSYFKSRLKTTFGLRVDMNSFTTDGNNPLQTLSPRGAASFALNEKWALNASTGYYAKLPPYTVLGFGSGVNRNAKYIKSLHYVFGGEYTPKADWTITAEAFLKYYYDYPVSLLDGVSLANKGGGFGVLGNEPVVSNGRGRTWGVELFTQKLLTQRVYGVASYTLFFTNFDNGPGTKLYRSAWDNRHLVSIAGGYLIGKNKTWEVAAKFRLLGGAPYTPFDTSLAARQFFLVTGTGVPDRNRFNEAQTATFHQLDVRIDKKFFFKKWSLNLFIDIQNIYASRNPGIPDFDLERDRNGNIVGTPNAENTRVRNVALDSSNIIPSFGLRAKF